jgi:hypothetical protein
MYSEYFSPFQSGIDGLALNPPRRTFELATGFGP